MYIFVYQYVLYVVLVYIFFLFLVYPSDCADYRGYMPELEMWWLMLISAVIFFVINCLLDSYYLRKCVRKVLFKLEIFYYQCFHKENSQSEFKTLSSASNGNRNKDSQQTLSAVKLFKTYSGKPVVRNISIKLNKQECLGILGVNGAGKTTTFRMLTRDECIDDGKVDLTVNNKIMDIGKDEVSIE